MNPNQIIDARDAQSKLKASLQECYDFFAKYKLTNAGLCGGDPNHIIIKISDRNDQTDKALFFYSQSSNNQTCDFK